MKAPHPLTKTSGSPDPYLAVVFGERNALREHRLNLLQVFHVARVLQGLLSHTRSRTQTEEGENLNIRGEFIPD